MSAKTDIKHKFYQGEIFAMSGGIFNHATIQVNLVVNLANRLRDKASHPMSYPSVYVPSGLDTYPDISIYCNQAVLSDQQHTLFSPVRIVEFYLSQFEIMTEVQSFGIIARTLP